MSRPLKLSLIALAGLVVLAAGLLWALPEIVRRVALDQIPKRTGRAAAIGDVDLNLFTGRLAIKAFRLAEREGPEPFVTFERLDVKLSPLALLRSHVRVVEIALTAPSVRLVRTGPAEFNFSEMREPGAERPAIRVERMELVGIDFDWPWRAALVSAGFRRPRVEMERGADGSFNLRRMFTPREEGRAPSPPEPVPSRDAASAEAKPKGLLETMRLEFGKVRIEDGFIRFLDRTTQPAFSQDMSRLELTVADLGNRPDRRAKLALQSVVGGDAGLDIRREIGALGAPAWVDLVGELRNFKLPSVDPYTAANIGWVIRKGDLQYRVRFKLDGNQLAADNELVVGHLQVAPASASDEVKRRIGLPLGLIVALIKDQKGEIRASIPVTGVVNDPKVGLRDAIWTAVKNVLVNIVTAPFKAIGRLFSSEEKVEEPKVDPVIFAPGSAVVSPAMEEHLLRVGDFLRRAPFVSLSMAAVPARADVDALKDDAVAARLQAFRKERGLEDAAVALDTYFKERLPDVPVPPTVEERTALLRDRETVPTASLTDLARRRIEATRERLVAAEGIPAARLTVVAAAPAASPGDVAGEGRVEFAVVAGE